MLYTCTHCPNSGAEITCLFQEKLLSAHSPYVRLKRVCVCSAGTNLKNMSLNRAVVSVVASQTTSYSSEVSIFSTKVCHLVE